MFIRLFYFYIIKVVKESYLQTLIFFPQQSKFRETGVLTPEEFVVAGDHLVHSCPTWQWNGGVDGKKKDYLPGDKQFLITRNGWLICYMLFGYSVRNNKEKLGIQIKF